MQTIHFLANNPKTLDQRDSQVSTQVILNISCCDFLLVQDSEFPPNSHSLAMSLTLSNSTISSSSKQET